MPIVVDLLLREVAMLGVLSAVGSGVAAFLPPGGRVGSRVALAPSLGLAVAGSILTTAGWWIPMKTAAWAVLLPVAVVSVGVALWQWGHVRRRPRPSARVVVALLLVAAVALTAINWPLVARSSLGPVAYQVYDAEGYVSEMQADKDQALSNLSTLPRAIAHSDGGRDLSVIYGSYVVRLHQQVGYSEVSAAVVELFGWQPSTAQSAFLSVLVVVGAFGAFAAVVALTGRRSWAALVAALLFAGPLFYELFLDGSEAALAGLAILPAFVVIGANVLRRLEAWSLVVLAILAGGLVALYPPLVPPVAVAAGLAVVTRGIVAVRRRELGRARLGRAAVALVGLVAGVAVVAPVALYRAVDYWTTFASNPDAYSVSRLPHYKLPLQVLPGWVLQTREFYVLPTLSGLPLSGWLLSAVIPGVLIVVVAFGVYRFPRTLVVIALVAAAALMAWATFARDDCTYCVQRTLLVVGPMGAIAIAVGLQALWEGRRLWWRIAAAVVALGVLVVAGQKTTVGVRRAIHGAYALPASLRAIQGQLHRADGPIYLEAIGQGYEAPIEFPATYEAANEATRQQLSVSLESDDYAGLAYVSRSHPPRPYTPGYRWVLTRAQGIATARRRVFTVGPFALEQRTDPLDVAITSGVALDSARDDPLGRAWVQGPMTFWITGPGPQRVFLRLHLTGSAAIAVAKPAGSTVISRARSSADICVPVPASAAPRLRRVTVVLADYPPVPMQPSGRDLTVRLRPGRLVQLAGMFATTKNCRR